MSRDWLLYLDDVIDSAEKIQRFLHTATLETFSADELLFDAVLYNILVIGEAVKKLPARNVLPADERALWLRVGMAIKSGLGEEGFELWDAWSRTGLAVTTTAVLHPENETRLLSLHATDTRAQTRAVMRAIAHPPKPTFDPAP